MMTNTIRTSYVELGSETYAENYTKISIGLVAGMIGVLAVLVAVLGYMMI